jgi:hypothetical protein
LLRTRVQTTSTLSSCAPRCEALMFILCRAAKNEPRKRARTFPPSPPFLRANGVALSLHSCLREIKQLQILRWRFDIKSPTRKYYARCDCKNLCCLLRSLICTNFKQNGTKKILAGLLPAQTTRRGYPASEGQGRSRRERPSAFLPPLLVAQQEAVSKAIRERVRSTV